VVAGAGASHSGNVGLESGIESNQLNQMKHKRSGPVLDIQQEKEVEISSLEASEKSGKSGKSGGTGVNESVQGRTTKSKKRSKKKVELDVRFSIHVNEKLIRFCKFYKDTRDCNPQGNMAIFVRKHYYNDMHEKCEDDAGFVSWWYGVQGSLKERIKVKRTNIMSAIHKTFKGESQRRGDGEGWWCL